MAKEVEHSCIDCAVTLCDAHNPHKAFPAFCISRQMTEEQRAQMRERRQKFMAERKAAMESKMLEVVKKYVPEEAKAKELVKELQEAMIGARRPMTNRPRPMPKAAKPAEAAPAAK